MIVEFERTILLPVVIEPFQLYNEHGRQGFDAHSFQGCALNNFEMIRKS